MKKTIIITLLFVVKFTYSQVYNYLPLSISNIETNPSFVASNKATFLTSYSHINNFSRDDKFSMNNVKISKYFENYFSGIGLTISNTNTYDTLKYNHIGLSLAYRNIFFDKVYVKLGINYKIIDVSAPKGFFSKYNFEAFNYVTKNTTTQNLNTSITFSTSKELFYTTIGFLNITPSWVNETNYFSTYSYIKIGNFWNLFDGFTNKELSLLVINENNKLVSNNLSYYLTILNVWQINRNLSIKYGGDIGFVNNNYLNIRPYVIYPKPVGFYRKRIKRTEYLIFKISADFALMTNSEKQIYKPAYLISILYRIK